jgi:CheY-like chemotaxis protein
VKVLLIEDDPVQAQAAALFLRAKGGHEVVAALSGKEALSYRRTWRPDVVLLDVRLPGLAGLDLLRQLRALSNREGLPHIPVVLATAATPLVAVELKLDAEREGLGPVPAVLVKPLDPDLLLETLAHLEGQP